MRDVYLIAAPPLPLHGFPIPNYVSRMVPHADDEEDPLILFPSPSVGPVRRRIYARNPKHGPFDRGRISREPVNGQDALDWSVPVAATTDVRVGVDYGEGEFVVFRYHEDGEIRDRPWCELFHGYVVPWYGLQQRMRNALMKAGMADHRGRIL